MTNELRKKMEELQISYRKDNKFNEIDVDHAIEVAFTAAVDELTKVPEDVDACIDLQAMYEYNSVDQTINRNNFKYGAAFFKTEIMPSLIEQARVNGAHDVIKILRSDKAISFISGEFNPNLGPMLASGKDFADWLERELPKGESE